MKYGKYVFNDMSLSTPLQWNCVKNLMIFQRIYSIQICLLTFPHQTTSVFLNITLGIFKIISYFMNFQDIQYSIYLEDICINHTVKWNL